MNSKIAVLILTAAVLSTLAGILPQKSYAANVDATVVSGASNLADKAFSPNPIQAAVGDTVTWTNKDTTLHTVTSGKTPTPDNTFDSQYTLAPGKTFSYTFNTAGTFDYFCKLHPTMVGTVVVGGGGGGGSSGPVMITATDNGKSYTISSQSSSVTAKSATIAQGKVTVNFDKAGDVTLSLPTSMIKGITSIKSNNADVTFTPVAAKSNDTYTTISFTIPSGQTSVDIMGSFVVPEFPVAALVLVSSIIGVIALSRTRFSVFKGL